MIYPKPVTDGMRFHRSVLNANALAEYAIWSNPAVDPTAVIANLKSTTPDRLDDM